MAEDYTGTPESGFGNNLSAQPQIPFQSTGER
jgi:hypothetical protein